MIVLTITNTGTKSRSGRVLRFLNCQRTFEMLAIPLEERHDMKIRFLVVLAVLAVSALVERAPVVHAIPPSGTNVLNNVTANTTWTLAGSPYYSTNGDLQVAAGATLTIQPGVTVYVGGRMDVYGSLTANGTAAQPITITGPYGHAVQPGTSTWDGMTFYGAPAASSITNTFIESANRALAGIGVPSIRDDTFLDNSQAAFTQQGYPVTHSRFIGNFFALSVLAGGNVTDSDFSGNQVALLTNLNTGETAAVHDNNFYDNGIPATHYQAIANQTYPPC